MRNLSPGYEYYTVVMKHDLPLTGHIPVGQPSDASLVVCHVCDREEEADAFLMRCNDCLPTRDVVLLQFPELEGVNTYEQDGETIEVPKLKHHHFLGCKNFEEE